MLYNCLKILHIVSATLLLTSMAYSYRLWKFSPTPQQGSIAFERIQIQTWSVIIPFAIAQLGTGFTMVSLQHELSQQWILGSVIGFITVIGSWLSFMYFLLLSQQVSNERDFNQFKFYRRIQSIMLILCSFALLIMVFLMANKSAVM